MERNQKSMLSSLIPLLLALIIFFIGKYYLDSKFEKSKTTTTLEKESVQTIVDNFNSQIISDINSNVLPINTEHSSDDIEYYTYTINNDIMLIIEPEIFSNDPNSDIAKFMYIQINANSSFKNEGIEYVKYLIKANNDDMFDTDVTKILEIAKSLKSSYQTANIGTGIDLGIYEDEEHIQYQITRIYE